MKCAAPARASTAAARLRDESGVVVLGPLIVITVLVLVLGLLGYLRHRAPPRVSTEGREPRVAVAPLELRYGGVSVGRLAANERVWVYPLPDGQVAVYRSARAQRVVGFAPDTLLAPRPPR